MATRTKERNWPGINQTLVLKFIGDSRIRYFTYNTVPVIAWSKPVLPYFRQISISVYEYLKTGCKIDFPKIRQKNWQPDRWIWDKTIDVEYRASPKAVISKNNKTH